MSKDCLDIYNSYLRAYRKANSAPYTPRKKYETLPQEVKNKIERIKLFFEIYDVSMDDFFDAPYFIFSDTKYLPFDYYLSRKAIKSYSDFQKKLMMEGPDHERNLIKIKNSVIFVKNFCLKENVKFSEYLNHKKESVPSFITHLKNRDVSLYFLLGLDGFQIAFFSFDSNLLKFMMPDIYDNFELYSKKFNTSKNARTFVKIILNKKILC